MKYRVTLSLGRPTVDHEQLVSEARQLDDFITRRLLGRYAAEGAGSLDVLVDPVKGTMQIVVTLDVENALTAILVGAAQIHSAFEELGLSQPEHVVSIESEHVPDPAGEHVGLEHIGPPMYRD